MHSKYFYCKHLKIRWTCSYCLHMFFHSLLRLNWTYTHHARCATPQVIMIHQRAFISSNETGYFLSPCFRVKKKKSGVLFYEEQQQRPWNLQSVQHTITQIALKSFLKESWLKQMGLINLLVSTVGVFNEILWGSQLTVPRRERGSWGGGCRGKGEYYQTHLHG